MGSNTYSDEFKRDAVHQIMVRGYAVREDSGRLEVRTHSLYKWIKLFGDLEPKKSGEDHEAENRRLN
jgi:transposase